MAMGVGAVNTSYRTAIAFSIGTCRYLTKPEISTDDFGIPEFCRYIGRKPTLCRLLARPEAMVNARAATDTWAQKKFKSFIAHQGSSTFQINNRVKDCFSPFLNDWWMFWNTKNIKPLRVLRTISSHLLFVLTLIMVFVDLQGVFTWCSRLFPWWFLLEVFLREVLAPLDIISQWILP